MYNERIALAIIIALVSTIYFVWAPLIDSLKSSIRKIWNFYKRIVICLVWRMKSVIGERKVK